MGRNDICMIVTIVLLLLVGGCFLLPSFRDRAAVREEVRRKQVQVEELQNDLDEKEEKITKIEKGDPKTIEEIARDRFGLAKEGEVIYEVPREKK